MNLQMHHSRQISGQVPNQAVMLPELPHQNGNTVSNQIQNPSARLNAPSMDPELGQTRKHVQGKIRELLMQQCPQSHEVPYTKLVDIVKRLEEGLFTSATSEEEYMNLATLEQRIQILTKRPSMNNQNQQLSNASPPIGSMIPTPGFQQTGTSSVHSQQFDGNPQNDFAGLSDSIEPDAALNQGVSSEEPVMGQSDISQSAEGRTNNITREKQFENQQRWLLFLRHARRCTAPEGQCHDSNCSPVQKLLKHMELCNCYQCSYPRCRSTRVLVNHHVRCRDESCPVCVPVKNLFLL